MTGTVCAVQSKTQSQSITETQSLSLMKNLLRVSVSTICYLRNIFDESSFSDKEYCGLRSKVLEPHHLDEQGALVVRDPEAHTVGKWLEQGVFDALMKKFLRRLEFVISTTDEEGRERHLETYAWRISYSQGPNGTLYTINDGPMIKSKEELKKQAVSMIRSVVTFAHTLPALPDERSLTMRLFYFEEITPENYQPPFFHDHDPSSDLDSMSTDGAQCLRIRLGSISTPHHVMDIRYTFSQGEQGANDGGVHQTPPAILMRAGPDESLEHEDAPAPMEGVGHADTTTSAESLHVDLAKMNLRAQEAPQDQELRLEDVRRLVEEQPCDQWVSIKPIVDDLQMSNDLVRRALDKLFDAGLLERKPWGAWYRYRRPTAPTTSHAGQPKSPPQTPRQRERAAREPSSTPRVTRSSLHADASGDSDAETVVEGPSEPEVPVSSPAPRRSKRERACPAESPDEQGEDMNMMLSQESVRTGRKCSKTQPLHQSKRSRR